MKISSKPKFSWRGILDELSALSSTPFQTPSLFLGIALLCACLSVNFYVRCFPASLPLLKRVAMMNVLQNRAKRTEKQIPENQGVAFQGNKTMAGAKQPQTLTESFPVQVEREYAKLKDSYQDEHGRTYLMEFDPYAWARQVRNVFQHGFTGDEQIKGVDYDRFTLAPLGMAILVPDFFCYFSAFLARIASILPSFSLDAFLFYVPVFYALLFLTLLYFFIRRWSSDLSAFFATLLVGLVPTILIRSSAGWFDTDPLNAVLTLAVAWCLVEGAWHLRSLRGAVGFSMLAGIFQGLLALTWGGWWFLWVVAAAFYTLMFLADLRGQAGIFKRIRRALILFTVYIFVTFVFVYVFDGSNVFSSLIESFMNIPWFRFWSTVSNNGTIWPDTYKTISELSPLAFQGIMQNLFGNGIFALSGAGFLIMAVAGWYRKTRPFVVMLLCWFLFMFPATLRSNRFLFFLAIPFFALASTFWGDWLPQKLSEIRQGLKRLLGGVIFLACGFFMVSGSIRAGMGEAEHLFPMMNDGWHKALVFLADHTPPNAIANAWWDYGYWIKYYGNRRVIFDNGTQKGQLSYWMAKVLISQNEDEALSILRMLNNASDQTFDKLLAHFHDPFRAKAILDQLLKSDAASGAKILASRGVPKPTSDSVLNDLYKTPAPAYLIVDDGLWTKMPSISSLANWNIPRLFALRERKKNSATINKDLEDIFGLSPKAAEEVRAAVLSEGESTKEAESRLTAPVQFYSSIMPGQRQGTLLYFSGGLVLNDASKDALIYVPQAQNFGIPRKMLLIKNGTKDAFINTQGNDPRVAVIAQKGNAYQAVLTDIGLEDSLFVRLMLEEGAGLDHFQFVYTDPKNEVRIYKIIWDVKMK